MRSILFVLAWAMPALSQPIPRAEVRVIGPVEYGQPTEPARYTGHPRFHAFSFNAKPGDQIEAMVESKQAGMQAILTDARFERLAGGSAHFSAKLPSRGAAATYYILVSQESRKAAQYTLDLERPAAAAESAPKANPEAYLTCRADSDCIAVERAGCCHNGWKDAVNQTQVAAYLQAHPCGTPRPICPMYMVNDRRAPSCNQATGRCQMLESPTKP